MSESTAKSAPEHGPARRGWRWLRARWYRRWALDLLLIAVVLWAVGRFQARHLLSSGVEAPGFTLLDLDGRPHSLADYRGQPVVLVFWAPWCTVCRLESDNWARVQSWRADVRVLAVALAWEDRADVERFVGGDRAAYPVLLGHAAVGRDYRVDSFPTHYIIDREGRVAWQGAGYTPTVTLWLRLL